MAIEKEALINKIEDDLAKRNRNWGKIDNHLVDYMSLLEGGEVYDAVLENGWTHETITLRYSKDDLGYVTISGRVVAGNITGSTTITTLPTGYRPRGNFMIVPTYDLNSGVGVITDLRIGSIGNLGLVSSPRNITSGSRLSINFVYKGV